MWYNFFACHVFFQTAIHAFYKRKNISWGMRVGINFYTRSGLWMRSQKSDWQGAFLSAGQSQRNTKKERNIEITNCYVYLVG
jgi:hypothetical protein